MGSIAMHIKGLLSVAALAGLISLPQQSSAAALQQEAGTIEFRLHAMAVVPEVSSSIGLIGGHVDASTSFIPEIDGTYFFTPHWAVELIAGVTQHDIKAKDTALGNLDLGSVWLLPPTLTAQYHCQMSPAFDAYIGAGINYTFFLGPSLPSGGPVKSIGYDNNVGGAVQIGFDYALDDHWVANFDIKQLFLNTTATVNGVVKADVDVNPTLIGIGIGYRF